MTRTPLYRGPGRGGLGWPGAAGASTKHPDRSHSLAACVTRHVTVELLEATQAAGVLTCFTKPLDPKEVQRLLRTLFPHASWIPSP